MSSARWRCRAARAGQQVLISTGDKDMAQLVDELDHADQHHERHAARSRRRQGQVRRLSGADHRLPGAGRRQLRQHSRHRQGGPEDRRQVAAAVRHARRALAHVAEIAGKVGENLRAGLATLELSRQLATIRTDLELPLDARASSRRRARHRARCASCTRATSCARCCGSSSRRGAAAAARTARRAACRHAGADAPRRRARRRRRAERPRRRRRSSATTRRSPTGRTSSAGSSALRSARRCSPSTPRPPSLDYMQAEIVGVSFCIEPGRGGLRAAGARLRRRARAARSRARARSAASRCSRTPSAASSAST